jgi:2-(1,2-epoxy-1,2-dihydrophenyl)acetyl-CoA isomerase
VSAGAERSGAVGYAEDGAVAIITFNRPAALNAFDQGARLGVLAALQLADRNDGVRAIVLCGAGRGFSSGADLTEPVSAADVPRILEREYAPGILAIVQSDKPVIAAVHGFATGIAAAYVLACDLVVMGEGAFMQMPFARIGLVPDGGLCWQLAQRLGHRVAFEVAVEGERLAAARCRELRLVNRVVPDEQVLAETVSWARKLATLQKLALAGTKRALHAAGGALLEETMRIEANWQGDCVATADFKEGVEAFLGKRAPRFE